MSLKGGCCESEGWVLCACVRGGCCAVVAIQDEYKVAKEIASYVVRASPIRDGLVI